MGKITLKNISTATVNIISDRFRRELVPGRTIVIKREDYDNLMFDPGFNNLVKGHYVQIDGVSDEEAVVAPEEKIYDVAAIEKMLDTKDYTGFAKFLPNATMAEKDTVVKLAVDKGITDGAFTALIKKYCNVDVVSAFDIKRKSEEK
jgi:hypothetical protein